MAKKAEVIITCDASTVKQVLAGLNREMDKTKQRRQELQKMQEQGTKLTKTEQRELQQLIKYENALNEKTQKSEKDMRKFGEVMKDLSGSKLKDLKRALQEGKNALNKMSERDPGREKLVHDLKRIQQQIEKNTGAIKKQESAWGSLGTTLKNLVAYAFVFAGFNKLKGLFEDVIELNKQFSDQMANVRKVSGLAMKDIAQLAGQLSKIDSRTSLSGLMELAYTGSKLGFGNYGIEGLEAFARSAVKVQNALSEDMGEESMTALSKLVEVMGLIPKMGVERAMDAAGSAIFKLASTSTATGTNIIEFTKRLMGLANVSHVTTAELLALGSASDSMGLMAEVSATAFNKVFTSIQSNYKEIEKAVGLTEGTIKGLLNQGKTMEAIVTVFEQMHGMSMEEMQARGVFKALGSDGARLNNVMTTMANKIDMLREHLQTSNEAFGEATAVAKEYEIQMDTAAAYSERARNIWNKAYVNPEGVDVTKELAKAWYDVSKSLTESERFMFTTKAMLYGIIEAIKILIRLLPDIGLAGMVGLVAALIVKLRTTESLLVSLTAWYGKLNAAQKTFMKASLWTAAALAIWEIGSAIYEAGNRAKQTTEYMKGFNKTLSDVNKEQYAAVRQLDRYVTAINSATKGTKERAAAIANFNKIYKPYLSEMLTEKSTALDVAKAYQEVVRQMKAKIALQAKEKDIEKFVTPRVGWEADRLEEYDNSVSGTGRSQYNGTWLKGFVEDARNAGKSIADVAKELNDKVFHLSDERFANVYSQRGMDKVTAKGETTMTDAWGKTHKMQGIVTLGANSTEAQLQKAINYALQSYSTSNAMNKINRKYKPFEKDINSLNFGEDSIPPYEPDEDVNIDTGKGGKTGDDAKTKAREALKEARENAMGVISKVEEYYRLQEAAINEARADGELTESQAAQMVRSLGIMKNESLAEARRAVTSGVTENWDRMKNSVLPAALSDMSDLSRNLLQEIQEVPVKALHDELAKFNGGENVFGLDSGALFDLMNAKAAGNTREAARLRAKLHTEAEKMLKQYHVIETMNDKMRKDLEQIGLTTETYEQFAKRQQEGGKERGPIQLADGSTITDSQAYEQMASKFVGQGNIPYRINIENGDEALNWMMEFASTADGALEKWAQAFPDIIRWVELVKEKNEGKTLGETELAALQEAIPSIRAIFYELESYSSNIGKTIEQQVQSMTTRTPIGIDEIRQQYEQRRDLTEQLYNAEIQKAAGNAATIQQLEEQKNQALIDLEHKYQEERYSIQEKLGVTWAEAYEHEVAQYKNMLDKKLISEKEFQQKKGKLQMKLGTQYAQYYNGAMSNMVNALQEYEIAAVEAKYEAQISAAKENGEDTTALEEKKEEEIYEVRKKYAGMQFAVKISEIIANTAVAIMQAYAQLGPIGGSVAAAMLAVTGAAQLALAKAEYDKVMSATPSKSSKSTTSAASSAANTTSSKFRLGKGMLTYDEGNVKRFVGDDGRVYTAREDMDPGTGLVTHPIATTVQGQPALVAEKGPEIVVGRETTRNIMMNEPELIRYLAEYDKHHGRYQLPVFDAGNVAGATEATPAPVNNDNNSVSQTLIALNQTLAMLQQQIAAGIRANINMYGTDGLYEQHKKAEAFMKRYS